MDRLLGYLVTLRNPPEIMSIQIDSGKPWLEPFARGMDPGGLETERQPLDGSCKWERPTFAWSWSIIGPGVRKTVFKYCVIQRVFLFHFVSFNFSLFRKGSLSRSPRLFS